MTRHCARSWLLNDGPLVSVISNDAVCSALTPNNLLTHRSNPGSQVEKTYGRSPWSLGASKPPYSCFGNAVYWSTCKPLGFIWFGSANCNIQSGEIVLFAKEYLHQEKWPPGILKECWEKVRRLVEAIFIRALIKECPRAIQKLCLLDGCEGNDWEKAFLIMICVLLKYRETSVTALCMGKRKRMAITKSI